jgi:hypothetical protein
MLRSSSEGLAAARDEFERDWRWVQAQIGARERGAGHHEPRPATREELVARIERQRERIAQLQAMPLRGEPGFRREESLSATAVRTAKEHPVAATAVAAGVVLVVGPRRLARWAAWIAPVLWRIR